MTDTIKTEFGSFTVEEPGWGGYVTFTTQQGDGVRIFSPEANEPDSYELEVRIDSAYLSNRSEIEDSINLLRFSSQLIGLLEDATEETREEIERLNREEREKEEREAKEREEAIQERKDRLMMEFMGDEVKVRQRGYQTMRRAKVTARQDYFNKDEYLIGFEYFGQEQRTQYVDDIVRLDIKVGSRWKTLWDDGTADIGGDHWLATSAKPTGEMYDSMREEH
jgi:hypothetical protein